MNKGRMWPVIGTLALLLSQSLEIQAAANGKEVLASIDLRNPTAWEGAMAVEVPVGRIATPGLIDWSKVRLLAEDGNEVPFAIREGRPHWKARLTAPVTTPRAEDLLVFSATPRRDAWTRIKLVVGARRDMSALREEAGQLVVSYPGLEVAVAASSGMLTRVTAFGEAVLDKPLGIRFTRNKQPLNPVRATLTAKSSTAAMTEMHFVIEVDERLAMALSYRIHACGQVEVWLDERPWQGASPWVERSAEIALPLSGATETLPHLLNRVPFYGFKDYEEVVKHVASVRRLPKAGVLELGEETTNGRRWNRRLFFLPGARAGEAATLAKAADEGVIVDVAPASLAFSAWAARIAHPLEDHVAADRIAEALDKRGVEAKLVGNVADVSDAAVVLKLAAPEAAPGIEGDGFEIRPNARNNGVVVTACTRFGLTQAALRMAEHLAKPAATVGLPLVAGNPASHLRSGGFGGGDFEVGFPYGSESEWRETFEQLVASGMNVVGDLGMWGNWKMPVSYRYMPELRSTDKDAHDEVSGAKFAEFDAHREHALRLIRFLHDRGVKVWLWLPIGCVPTTYAKAHPEAMSPGNPHAPCFTHPLYNRYLEAFFQELLETYAIDGMVMIRDDNGGRCACDRCKDYVAKSSTKDAIWEQYLIIYRRLRERGFKGDMAVYPYWDLYQPRLDPLLPPDLYVIGHGSGAGMLSRDYERLGPMGDTWLDNLFCGFRPPTSARMKRLLADRGSFWIGGAFCGNELTTEAVGYFGWEPTATVNSLRYQSAARRFGQQHAFAATELADAREDLLEIYDLPMLPREWIKLKPSQRQEIATRARARLQQFRQHLAALRAVAGDVRHEQWFRHIALFGTFFESHLRRLEIFVQMNELVVGNKHVLKTADALPPPVREKLIAMHQQIYVMAAEVDREAATVPGAMMARTRSTGTLLPFFEWNGGWIYGNQGPWLDSLLEIKLFAGTMTASPAELPAGQPFVLRVELHNRGVCTWLSGLKGAFHHLLVKGEAQKRLGLPEVWYYDGAPMVFGDRRVIELRGTTPKEPGEAPLNLSFVAPARQGRPFMRHELKLRWK